MPTMKTATALLIATATLLHAGTSESVVTVEPVVTEAPQPAWLTPTLDIRTRYEFGNLSGFDHAHAWTFRGRVGLKTAAWHGLSAFVEGEFSQAVVDDYHGGAAGANPFDPSRTLIADPETNELNQAWIQYEEFNTIIRGGRQRMIYDNAAFIGNVGWRQNEQTFDAISLSNQSIDGLTVKYAYLNQINRIFGSDASGPPPNASDIDSDTHLFNLSYSGIEGLTLGAYAYLMDFPGLSSWDNHTFGASAAGELAGLSLYGELAWQDKAGATSNRDAFYAHAKVTKALQTDAANLGSLTLGVEHLDAGFKTPLATLHAFNGFADVFLVGRTNGSHNGLTNTYLAHSLPVLWDMNWSNILHLMGDSGISTGYGWEYDSVLSKKFNDHFTAIAKLAWFTSEGAAFTGNTPLPNATRFSVEVNYTF